MAQKIQIKDIYSLALGAGFLGSGGGGDPHYEIDMAVYQIMQYGEPTLIEVENLQPEDLVLPLAFVGAPLVCQEKLISGKEFPTILQEFEQEFGRLPTAILPAEIGGSNSLAPFLIASKMKLPIINGDLIGRAFPRLEIASPTLYGITPTPVFVSDSLGNSLSIKALNAHRLEELVRAISIASGSSIAFGGYIMNGITSKRTIVRNSILHAIDIGRSIQNFRRNIKDFADNINCNIITEGDITDVNQIISQGFLKGEVTVKGQQGLYVVDYQNEYLRIKKGEEIIITTPDIISILDRTTLTPISSERLMYGQKIYLVTMKAQDLWYSRAGIELVGPAAFNLN